MTTSRSLGDLLHRATHRLPGIPAHAVRPAGHQGAPAHGRAAAAHPSSHHGWNHAPGRGPRFMPAWQRRIAAFFGREL